MRLWLAVQAWLQRYRIGQAIASIAWYEEERADLWERIKAERQQLAEHQRRLAEIEARRMRVGRTGGKVVSHG